MEFKLHSKFKPAGGQPKAIEELTKGYLKFPMQTLQGITGSGKSLDYNEVIFYKENGLFKKCKIGEFVEENLNNFKTTKDTKYSEVSKNKKILSFNPKTGKIQEKFITQVSKHKEKIIFEIVFDDNSSIKVTKDHNFYKLNKLKFDLVETNDLNIGDIIPLTTFLPESHKNIKLIKLDFNQNLNLNIKNLLLKLSNAQKTQVLDIFKEHYNSPIWKYKQILNSSKERGVKIRIFLKIIDRLNLDLNKIKNEIFFVSRDGKDRLPFIIELNDKLVNFLGLYVAEGHSRKDGYIISNSQNNLQKLSLNIAKKLRINNYKRNENDIFYYSSIFSNFLTKYFGNLAYKKRVPSFIFNLESKKIGLFLQGLFDGDGWVEENSLHLSSVSKRLIEDIRYLLLLFGITSRMGIKNKNNKSYYQVNISGKNNLKLFRKNINFSINYKYEKLRLSIKDSENTNVDLIPDSGFLFKKVRRKYSLYQKDLAKILNCEQSYVSMLENNSRRISKKLFEKLILWLKNEKKEDIHFYKNLLKFNLRRVKEIREINSFNGYVYDIAVEDNETFLAGNGGVFVHNTFVVASAIEKIQKPTLVLAHNKTLAAQLYQELKEFFPQNKVEYFISYYDYYQPESYIPTSDTYIDKEATVNEEIEKMRLKTIASLMSRDDVIVVASISCIYGAGNPEDFKALSFEVKVGDEISRSDLIAKLVDMQYSRNDVALESGTFRVRGDVIDIFPSYIDEIIRIEMFGDEIDSISVMDKVTGDRKDATNITGNSIDEKIAEKEKLRFTPSKGQIDKIRLFPSKQFVVEEEKLLNAIEQIKAELKERAQELNLLEETRLKQRVKYDIEMMEEVGYCTGIENYSRFFDNRKPGTPPHVLLDYFPQDFTLIIDESHQTIPQAHAMYKGDYSRKKNLVDFGFRLPSAFDNRPLKFEEFEKYFKHTIFVSATPGDYEVEHSGQMVEQIIRPTGLLDPIVEVRPSTGQVKDLLKEIRVKVEANERVLVTTLTKRMAEDLTDYFSKEQIKVRYMHSDIDSLDRIELVRQLRAGEFDVLVGINLLREGLDIPEVSLVAILDSDKEGFLRNERSLIQTIGRAARNSEGKVIMYADKETVSMKKAIQITKYRREIQEKFNKENNIVPKTILKKVEDKKRDVKGRKHISKTDFEKEIIKTESDMKKAAENLDFELAIRLRDRLEEMKREV